MEKLLAYLNGLSPAEQQAFALRCGTSLGYLRKAASVGQRLGEGICLKIDRESGGLVLCEDLRADVDWAYLRNSRKQLPDDFPGAVPEIIQSVTEVAQAAIKQMADVVEAEIKHVTEVQAAIKIEVRGFESPVKLPPLASTEEADSLELDERRRGLPTRRLKKKPFIGPDKRVGPPDRRGFKLPEVAAVLPKGV